MSELFFSTMKRLQPVLRQGDLERCEREVAEVMRGLEGSPFHVVLDLQIINPPKQAAEYFDAFFEKEGKRFSIGAAYTEMNGFDINPDRWFCSPFAYETDWGCDEFDWLSNWKSERCEDFDIWGFDELQEVYASDAFSSGEYTRASYISSLMVVVKFQRLMAEAAKLMKRLAFPLYVTAHEFDFIAAVGPVAPTNRPQADRIEALLRQLEDSDDRTRFRAIAGLLPLGEAAKRAVPRLIELLSGGMPATRQLAARALSYIDPNSDEVKSAIANSKKQ